MEVQQVRLDAGDARRILLARAIDEADAPGRLLGAPERERIEQDAAAAARGPDGAPEPVRYLRERAARVLAAVENRNPRLAGLQHGEPWRRTLAWGLPLAAIVVGAALDRIDNPGHVNMLSPPLLAVLLWNLGMYLLLLVGMFWRPDRRQPPAWQRWLAQREEAAGRPRGNVRARFAALWLQATAREQALWWQQLLHGTAAAWAIGLGLSIVIGGLVRQYRVGWESTLLDLPQVHAFLQALFAPVVALLPFDAFSAADLQRMHFASGQEIATGEARRWVGMYLALLALVIVLPRLLLAGVLAWRRRLASEVLLDLGDGYFAPLLARVSPAAVVLGLPAGPARASWLRLWNDLAGAGTSLHAGEPWTVLATPQGDRLQVLAPAGEAVPAPGTAGAAAPAAAPALASDSSGGGKAGWWARWRERGPGREGGRPRPQPGPSVDLWLEGAEDEEAAPSWIADEALRAGWRARLPPAKHAGFDRLAAVWARRGEDRFAQAMQLLAALAARAAADGEDVPASASWLRGILSGAERDAQQRARQDAFAALVQRLAVEESATLADLHRLHGLPPPREPVALARAEAVPPDAPAGAATPQKAGLAGAASGAAMGAGIDLVTGGLTLGAAAALGALLGGGASVAASLWRQRDTPAGRSQVQLSDEMLQTLTESLLLHYLSCAVRARTGHDLAVPLPAAWRSETIAAVEARRDALRKAWQTARAGDRPAAEAALAGDLAGLARGLLAAIRRPCAGPKPPAAASPPRAVPPAS